MNCSEWERARTDFKFAKAKAREVHDARFMALELSPEVKDSIGNISECLDRNFFKNGGRSEILRFYNEIASDLSPCPDIEESLWFLRDIVKFLPKQGRPSKEALQGAIFWLLLYYHGSKSKKLNVGVGRTDNPSGTQVSNSELVDFLQSAILDAGIEQYGSSYQSSTSANATRAVIRSPSWLRAASDST